MEAMPIRNTRLLGATSLWVGIPAFYALRRAHAERDARLATLACTLACVCLASTLLWARPVTGSARHQADRLLCALLALELVAWHAQWPMAGVLLFYGISHLTFRRARWTAHLAAHTLFRYAFYWWVHGAVLGVTTTDVLRLTAGYATSALALYRYQVEYWRACAITAAWVALHV